MLVIRSALEASGAEGVDPSTELGDGLGSLSARATSPSVSVVIPTRNRHGKVTRLLEHLTAANDDIEVVVVDDHSDDETFEALAAWSARDPRIVALRSGNPGHAAGARMQGALAASGEVLVMLDDDVVPMPGLALAHAAHHHLTDNSLLVGYIPTRVPDPVPPGAFATVLYAREYEARCAEYEADPARILTGLWMGNASLRRETYLEAMQPERMPLFPYRHQDRLLGIVLRDLGVTGTFDRSLRAEHEHSRTLSDFLEDSYLNGQGRAEIHRLRPDVLPEDPEQLYLSGLPSPLRAVVSATRHDVVRKIVGASLVGGIRIAESLHLQSTELNFARLARKVAELQGERDLLATELEQA